MIKKILLSCASIFLLWQSTHMLNTIEHINPQSIGMQVFAAWIINMFITGTFAFAGFAFPSENLLPDSYYSIKKPKKLKAVFRFFKVDLFRKMLLATLWT